MASITLKGREIPLLLTSEELKVIQQEIAPLDQVLPLILGRNPDDENDTGRYLSPEQIGAVAAMIRILGNAGLEEAGETPDLTDKKIARAIRPVELPGMVNACMAAWNEGMISEIPPKEEEGPVDVTLEAMKKKDEKDG